ncbi:MAG: hypothetical protein AB1779_05055 [Candidatus Thermoplasmatota archaeon]
MRSWFVIFFLIFPLFQISFGKEVVDEFDDGKEFELEFDSPGMKSVNFRIIYDAKISNATVQITGLPYFYNNTTYYPLAPDLRVGERVIAWNFNGTGIGEFGRQTMFDDDSKEKNIVYTEPREDRSLKFIIPKESKVKSANILIESLPAIEGTEKWYFTTGYGQGTFSGMVSKDETLQLSPYTPEEEEDQIVSTTFTDSINISGSNWVAQTFTPAITGWLIEISIYVKYDFPDPGVPADDLHYSVCDVVDGIPGNVLASDKIACTQINQNTFKWTELKFTTPAYLWENKEYAIVLSSPGANISGGGQCYVLALNSNNPYSSLYGYAWMRISNDSGSSWGGSTFYDFGLKTYMRRAYYGYYGYYISQQIPASGSNIINATVNWSESIPKNTEIKFYVSRNDGLYWSTPISKGSTYPFDNSEPIGNLFRYKVEMFGDGNATPVIDDIGVNLVLGTYPFNTSINIYSLEKKPNETNIFNKSGELKKNVILDFSDALKKVLSNATYKLDLYENKLSTIVFNVSVMSPCKLKIYELNITYEFAAKTPNFARHLTSYVFGHISERDDKGLVLVPLTITTKSPGKLKISNLSIEYDNNILPIAIIESIKPNPANISEPITFCGRGADKDGHIKSYYWESNINGPLSDSPKFTTTSLKLGNHTIKFKVKDNMDRESEIAIAYLLVKPPNHLPIVNIKSPSENENISKSIYVNGIVFDEDNDDVQLLMKIDENEWMNVTDYNKIEGKWGFFWDTKSVGNGQHKIAIRAYDGNDFVIVERTVNVVNDIPGIEFYPPENKYGTAGQNITYTIEVLNSGTGEDKFSIHAISSNNWYLISPSETKNLKPKESMLLNVSLIIPLNASIFTKDIITLSFISSIDSSFFRNLSITTTVVSVEISIFPPNGKNVKPGKKVEYEFEIKNNGLVDENITLEAKSSNGWLVELLGGNRIKVASGAKEIVIVRLTVPKNAGGKKDTLELIASSTIDPTVSSKEIVKTKVLKEEKGFIPSFQLITLVFAIIFYFFINYKQKR